MKKMALNFLMTTGIFLAVLIIPSEIYAKHGGGGEYYKLGEETYACPVTSKLMTKAYFFLKNKKELGLSEDQVKSIKGLKLETKKAYILQMADHQVFELDLMHKLSEPKVDVKAIQDMIDKHSSAMTAATKETVVSYAKLKSVLTQEQLDKAKELHSQFHQ